LGCADSFAQKNNTPEMMRKVLCYCIAVIAGIGFANAQKSSLIIKIADEQHLNLPGATVIIDNNKSTAVSDNTGSASLYNLSIGSHQLAIHYIGYKDYTTSVTIDSL